MRIELKAHAKINWALWVCGLRPDGYHELDMLLQQVSLCDRLTFEPDDALTLYVDGALSDDPHNLILRAARALRTHAGVRRGARIALEKHIPARAGLGGGSADCAATLLALNQVWALNLSQASLRAIGLRLGADVPYCLTGGLCRVRGAGEIIERCAAGPRAHLAMARLGEGLSTADVFRAWDDAPAFPPRDVEAARDALLSGNYAALRALAHNALAAPAAALLPEIAHGMRRLYACGALYAQMSGSGSTVYGVFSSRSAAVRAAETLGKNTIVTETLP